MLTLKQIIAVSVMNLRNLPSRATSSLVIVVGIAGVVAVLVSVLAMATGFLESMQGAGRNDRAIVVRQGASTETASSLTNEAKLKIMDAPGVATDNAGNALASGDVFTVVLLSKKDGTEVSVPVRGVGEQAFKLRPEVEIVEGRMFEPSLYEVIVGENAQAQYQGLEVGSSFKLRSATWNVVGTFTSNGDTHESELFTNSQTLQTAMRRGGSVQSVTVQLTSPEAFTTFKDALTTDPSVSVDVWRESEFMENQSSQVQQILSMVAYVIGSIMAVGAIFAALNTMYSAVSNRSVEIATLRALGFGSGPIVSSVLLEALLLALIGGILGALLGWLVFDGNTVSTAATGSAGESRVFSLYVSPGLMVLGIVWACVIGFLGGLFPAIRAARLPVASALRES